MKITNVVSALRECIPASRPHVLFWRRSYAIFPTICISVAASMGFSVNSAAANGAVCNAFNPAQFQVGAEWEKTSRMTFSGMQPYISFVHSKVAGTTSFLGHNVLDVTTIAKIIPKSSLNKRNKIGRNDIPIDTFYRIGGNSVYFYGTSREYTDPPQSFPKKYAVNVPYTSRFVNHIPGKTAASSMPGRATRTFLGMETTTVPAGAFMTCKIREQIFRGSGKPAITDSWVVTSGKYVGFEVKSESYSPTGSPTGKSVTLSMRLNGS